MLVQVSASPMQAPPPLLLLVLQTTFVFTSELWGRLCNHTWTFAARSYNQVGASATARFADQPFIAGSCSAG